MSKIASSTATITTTTATNSSNKPKIPRPMNCFLAFRLEKQNEIVARCPGANHRDISKIIAKWWKETPESEKEPYRERARLAKIEHAKMYPDYKYKPQKRSGRKTRKYMRRPQNKFTSRIEKNNRMMEMFYSNPRLLDCDDSASPSSLSYDSDFPQEPSPMASNAHSPASSSATQDDVVLSPACYGEQQPMVVVDPSSLFYQQSAAATDDDAAAAAAMYYDWSLMPTGPTCMEPDTTTTNPPCTVPSSSISDEEMALVTGCIDPRLLTACPPVPSDPALYPTPDSATYVLSDEDCYGTMPMPTPDSHVADDLYMVAQPSCAFVSGYMHA